MTQVQLPFTTSGLETKQAYFSKEKIKEKQIRKGKNKQWKKKQVAR